jgi:putative FmdB family regulatory protein
MPLYEYECTGCGHRFEQLSRSGVKPSCPTCQSEAVTKQLSVFAVSTGGGKDVSFSPGPGACGTCGDPRGPGACSMN